MNPSPELNIVTGAFSYTGKYLTRRLLAAGKTVKTLTHHPQRAHEFGTQVEAMPYNFDRYAELVESLRGATTLYNTYWVRFNYGMTTYDQAIANTQTLFRAAKEAGLKRVVHVSIVKPDLHSPLPYYSGKARLEQALIDSGLSYAIIRPTVIFGAEDILINNIAWIVRHLPAFGIPGQGDYRLQPIDIEDMAELMFQTGQTSGNQIVDAVGPEIYTFDTLIKLIAAKLRRRIWIFHISPKIALFVTQILSRFVGDVILTQAEIDGLMADLLVSDNPPTGRTRLSDWLEQNRETVGTKYHSEVARHFKT
jgi:uncharacterized protein YbjT (DUF2867 family)